MTSPAPSRRGGALGGLDLPAVGVPLLLVGVVVLMVVPLPAVLLDLLLATNIALSVVVLLTAMTVRRAVDFSVFPALILVLTLFRLGLNVSSTRLILLDGQAGKVIAAFGEVVIGGSLVVGLVVFLILVVIQFAVITSGSGRVAEVSARFTLDALPGKQMAIDADLNAGLIDDEQAKRRRREVATEADFFGAMDGASKFVKGDAIAAVVIVVINLVGGFAIGVAQKGMSLGESISTYAVLSVGDGLVSQVPALLLSVAAGIVVTRVVATEEGSGLGDDLVAQLGRTSSSLRVAAVALAGLGLVPGMPTLPFLALAAGLAVLGARAARATRQGEADEARAAQAAAAPTPEQADTVEPGGVEPLELELAPDLLDLLDPSGGGSLLERVRALRRRVADELGVVVPAVRSRDSVALPPSTYVVRVHGVEQARGTAPPGHALVLGDDAAGLGGRPTTDPVFGLPAAWVPQSLADVLVGEGATVVDRASLVVTHLSEVVRAAAGDLLSRQDVSALVDAVKDVSPVVAADVGSADGLTLVEVQRVLRDLLGEGVPIRDLVRILEAVTARSREDRSPDALLEAARRAVGPAVAAAASTDGRLPVLTLEPVLEHALLEQVRPGEAGAFLALDAPRLEALLDGVGEAVLVAERTGVRPALLCSAPLRLPLRRLVAPARPDLVVLSFAELGRATSVEPVGTVTLAATPLQAVPVAVPAQAAPGEVW